MKNMTIRKSESKDLDRILALNEESVHFLSPLSMTKLKYLVSQSEMVTVVDVDGCVEAFVITFREGKAYDSVNYLWFVANYKQFLYVDRVVVSKEMHGKGLGTTLYEEVLKHAKLIKVPYVTAEIDINPPNPVSLKFHEKFGFKEVGKQTVYDGKKVVSLQAVSLV